MPSNSDRLYGCRQLVGDEWVKSVTSATLVLSYQHLGWALPKETAGDKPEEGGMTSVMALTARATRATMVGTKVAAARGGVIP